MVASGSGHLAAHLPSNWQIIEAFDRQESASTPPQCRPEPEHQVKEHRQLSTPTDDRARPPWWRHVPPAQISQTIPRLFAQHLTQRAKLKTMNGAGTAVAGRCVAATSAVEALTGCTGTRRRTSMGAPSRGFLLEHNVTIEYLIVGGKRIVIR
jgi:hypothetical protein